MRDLFADFGCVHCPREGSGPHAPDCPETTGVWPTRGLDARCGSCDGPLGSEYRTIPSGPRHPMGDIGGALEDVPTELVVCLECGEGVAA